MKVVLTFTFVALISLGLLLILGCNDSPMAPTEPLKVQDQATLAKVSPDLCSKLVYSSYIGDNREIFVMNTDGSGQTNLTDDPSFDATPSWSPGQEEIVFTSNREGGRDLYIMKADGTYPTPLETEDGLFPWYPDWSPSGDKIVFVGFENYGTSEQNADIYVINVDGTDLTRLTDNPAIDGAPSWSPDEQKLAFHSERDGDMEIYVMNADGSEQTNLTNSPKTLDQRPAWSPDGTKIAFDSDRLVGTVEIYVMDADGTGRTRLTDYPRNNRRPVWSPDGKKIAFERMEKGNFEIYVMNANGSKQTRLTDNRVWDMFVDWGHCDNDDDE